MSKALLIKKKIEMNVNDFIHDVQNVVRIYQLRLIFKIINENNNWRDYG